MKRAKYVDLWLPSGTLWADSNVDDKYYTYDTAIKTYTNQLPTRAQFCELIEYTTYTWDKDKNGMIFTGKNGNSIFLPLQSNSRKGLNAYWANYSYDNLVWSILIDPTPYVSVFSCTNDITVLRAVRLVKTNFLNPTKEEQLQQVKNRSYENRL